MILGSSCGSPIEMLVEYVGRKLLVFAIANLAQKRPSSAEESDQISKTSPINLLQYNMLAKLINY